MRAVVRAGGTGARRGDGHARIKSSDPVCVRRPWVVIRAG